MNIATAAAERRQALVHAVDRAVRRAGGHCGEHRGAGGAEADLLAFHVGTVERHVGGDEGWGGLRLGGM